MRVAIVGAGVSGLVAARLLHRECELTVFESGTHAGGHAHTLDVELAGRRYPVDVGFMVFNEKTYPRFTGLLRRLRVASKPTRMSFSVRCEASGLEYCGTSLNTVFAQRSNLLRPAFLRMLRDIVRFNRSAPRLLRDGVEGPTLGEVLERGRYGRWFIDRYLVPMGSAIWSASPRRLLDFPATFLLRFFDNHGLLTVDRHHPWRVVDGGSRRYVEALVRPFRDRIRLATPVEAVRRADDGAIVRPAGGPDEHFDHAILAVHADRALSLLPDAGEREREILGAFPYSVNDCVLHSDVSLLPRRPLARACWNYHVPREPADRAVVTYDLARLQHVDAPRPLLLTLNRGEAIDPRKVLRRLRMSHPVYSVESVRARQRHAEISGDGPLHFCGAYWGNGFHEDGVRSAIEVCRRLRRARVAA